MAALPSTRAAPIRRFIYLIVSGGVDRHTLHRIDTSPLFAAGVGVDVPAQQEPGWRSPPPPPPQHATLPSPLARFTCAAGRQFLPLGRDVEKIVTVDRNRHTVIFDTGTDSVRAGPDARHVKCHGHGDAWAEAGGRIYHLGRDFGLEEQACLDFEVLTHDPHRDDWSWNLLPSPPLERYENETVQSFADARGAGEVGAGAASAIIRISTSCNKTYAFDAACGSWREEGEWTLPFRGRAQYVADYGLWFGFTDDQDDAGRPVRRQPDLCAADLDVAGRPACRHVWTNADGQANYACNWSAYYSYLSYLGSGRFCITRIFSETDKDGRHIFTPVVTAVEATRAAASASATGEMQMVRRASVRYHCPEYASDCWAY